MNMIFSTIYASTCKSMVFPLFCSHKAELKTDSLLTWVGNIQQ